MRFAPDSWQIYKHVQIPIAIYTYFITIRRKYCNRCCWSREWVSAMHACHPLGDELRVLWRVLEYMQAIIHGKGIPERKDVFD